ncbi:secreted RxLR effector protein 161-like [Benincasa hispida]|uniref:secreted RxLR effector protein 161-like n=1 Tax=Benincasa hispida TaxID=102211 RepID=UPI001900C367|nr:secreted RxLR effector protein 161-like [Benincasa hispida]
MKDLGSLIYFFSLEVSLSSASYSLSQVKYASDLLVHSSITNSATVPTPLDPNVRLTIFDGNPLEDVSLYRQLVGSLIYLIVTHPDIAYTIHIVSQLMVALQTIHFTNVLRILRYVKGYSDADWAGDPTNRRSTSGYCFYLDDSLISWCIKKQSVVSCSSMESEYRALVDAMLELLWLRWLIADMGVPQSLATKLDNRNAT